MTEDFSAQDHHSEALDEQAPYLILSEEEIKNWREKSEKLVLRIRDGEDLYSRLENRVIVRPKIKWLKCLILFGGAAFPLLIAVFLLNAQPRTIRMILPIIAAVLCIWLMLAKPLLIQFIQLYQAFAPEKTRRRCKCFPSCSEYAIEALEKHGLWKGFRLGIRRLCRCGTIRGDDPVP